MLKLHYVNNSENPTLVEVKQYEEQVEASIKGKESEILDKAEKCDILKDREAKKAISAEVEEGKARYLEKAKLDDLCKDIYQNTDVESLVSSLHKDNVVNDRMSSESHLRFREDGKLSVDRHSGLWRDFEKERGGWLIDLVGHELRLGFKGSMAYMRDFIDDKDINLRIDSFLGSKPLLKEQEQGLQNKDSENNPSKLQEYLRRDFADLKVSDSNNYFGVHNNYHLDSNGEFISRSLLKDFTNQLFIRLGRIDEADHKDLVTLYKKSPEMTVNILEIVDGSNGEIKSYISNFVAKEEIRFMDSEREQLYSKSQALGFHVDVNDKLIDKELVKDFTHQLFNRHSDNIDNSRREELQNLFRVDAKHTYDVLYSVDFSDFRPSLINEISNKDMNQWTDLERQQMYYAGYINNLHVTANEKLISEECVIKYVSHVSEHYDKLTSNQTAKIEFFYKENPEFLTNIVESFDPKNNKEELKGEKIEPIYKLEKDDYDNYYNFGVRNDFNIDNNGDKISANIVVAFTLNVVRNYEHFTRDNFKVLMESYKSNPEGAINILNYMNDLEFSKDSSLSAFDIKNDASNMLERVNIVDSEINKIEDDLKDPSLNGFEKEALQESENHLFKTVMNDKELDYYFQDHSLYSEHYEGLKNDEIKEQVRQEERQNSRGYEYER